MTKRSRRKFTADFKAKVVLEALKERSTIEELARKYELHPTQINTWKREAVANMAAVFSAEKAEGAVESEQQTEKTVDGGGQRHGEAVGGGETVGGDGGAEGAGSDVVDDFGDDGERDVGLDEGEADLAQGFGDVLVGDGALAAEGLEGTLEFVA